MSISLNSGQMYKVFFNDRIVTIDCLQCEQFVKDGLFYRVSSYEDVQLAWKKFIQHEGLKFMLLSGFNDNEIMSWLKQLFKVIVAGGGLAYNINNELLCIYRLGKWDLPKGKIEKGETIEQGALREVEEECGISGVELLSYVSNTYHLYHNSHKNNELTLKETHWFNMLYKGNELLVPQLEESISKVEWISKDQIENVLENTYASLISVFENAFRIMV